MLVSRKPYGHQQFGIIFSHFYFSFQLKPLYCSTSDFHANSAVVVWKCFSMRSNSTLTSWDSLDFTDVCVQ